MKTEKLRRSKRESVIGGVSGGLGTYFNTDPVIFRILFVVLAFTGGGGVFIYLLMWIFVPMEDMASQAQNNTYQNENTEENTSSQPHDEDHLNNEDTDKDMVNDIKNTPPPSKKKGSLIGGAILIIVGIFFLADDFFPWFNWEYLWPVALIVAGLAIIKINYEKK